MTRMNAELPNELNDTLTQLLGLTEQDRLSLAQSLLLSLPHTLMAPSVEAANKTVHTDGNMDRAQDVIRMFSHVERDVRIAVESLTKTRVELNSLKENIDHIANFHIEEVSTNG